MKNTATFRQLVYCLRPQIKWMKKRENREKIIIALEKEIAQKLGISVQAVIFWRNSEKVPMERVVQLSMIYKKDIYEFLEIESNAAEGKTND